MTLNLSFKEFYVENKNIYIELITSNVSLYYYHLSSYFGPLYIFRYTFGVDFYN